MSTQTRIEEAILNRRFNIEKLQRTLNEVLGKEVQITEVPEEELLRQVEDFRLDIGTKESGYGSVWYLKTRAGHLYITEVVYEEE